ncbi:MAG: CarD family transcriptional regulator [Acutalibacteraceae bacterium]
MFEINDVIAYGTTGICKIEDIRSEKLFSGDKKKIMYYILKPIYSPGSTVYVPVDNEKMTVKMRYILTKDEIDDMINQAKNKRIEWINDDQSRAVRFNDIMANGICADLLTLVKCLYDRKQQLAQTNKKFHAADERVLLAAEKSIKEEFAYVLEIDVDDVGNYILNRTA